MIPNESWHVQYAAGGPINQQTAMRKVDPFALAAAGLALGLDETEFAEFARRFNTHLPAGVDADTAYRLMIQVAYDIKKRRGTIADG